VQELLRQSIKKEKVLKAVECVGRWASIRQPVPAIGMLPSQYTKMEGKSLGREMAGNSEVEMASTSTQIILSDRMLKVHSQMWGVA
jgi:hypothetical protein